MSDIKVRVGQQNTIKIVSSVSGSAGGSAIIAENVIGGIADVTSLSVSGVSTFVGIGTFSGDLYVGGDLYVNDNIVFDEFTARNGNISEILTVVGIATFKNNVYIDGDLYIGDDLVFDEFRARNGNITGILTVGQSLYYPIGQPYGVAYFDSNDRLVSTGTTSSAISETNYILTTDNSGIPTWSSVIDGGTY